MPCDIRALRKSTANDAGVTAQNAPQTLAWWLKRAANAGVMAQTHCKECKKNGKNYHFIDAVYMPCESRAPLKCTTNAGVTAQTHCKRWCDGSNAPHRQVWRLKRTINAGVTAQTHHKRWRDGSNAPQTLMWRLKRTANAGVTAQKKCIFSSRFLFRPCHLTKNRKLKKALSVSVWEKNWRPVKYRVVLFPLASNIQLFGLF